MTLSSQPLPTAGYPNSTEDSKVRGLLLELQGIVNGSLDSSNLTSASVADDRLASPNNSTYRTVTAAKAAFNSTTSPAVGTTYLFNDTATGTATGAALTAPHYPEVVMLRAADFTVAGKTTKLRLAIDAVANGTATNPGIFTFGLYPVSSITGTGQTFYNLGTVVTGSTVAINQFQTNILFGTVGTDFTIPADGGYFLGFAFSGGAMTANSAVSFRVALQVRNI